MHNIKRQDGMTGVGWLIVLGLIAFFSLLTLKLLPFYLEYFKISTSINSVTEETGIIAKPTHEIRTLIDRRFQINDVSSITGRDVKIDRSGRQLSLSVDYEVRTPIMGNVDAVAKFKKSFWGP